MKLMNNLETKRLNLRFLEDRDLEYVYRQFSDEDMCRSFSEPACDMKGAQEIIDHYKGSDGEYFMRYAMFSKETGDFIGTFGYHYHDKELSQVELGYDVWKDYWRQGYATEILPLLINICFDDLKVNRIYILTNIDNEASINAAAQFGFKECDLRREVEEPSRCFELLKKEWEN